MSLSFSNLYQQLVHWAETAEAEGWIGHRQLDSLTRIETQEADSLFSTSGQRPLIVAFFGGTGVGKSTLLNRLAGSDIARTGVKRPTSQEVTLYIHRDFQLRELPAELPQQDAVVAYHDDDRRRMVAWLDLPDFDSTESSHRAQVETWLPYIDWVIYVVSPERYHDDIGWRFLQQRHQHHSWLFVINHWDEGRPEQREDFRARLQSEGFPSPIILSTDSSGSNTDDEFSLLESTINDSIRQFGLSFLQSLGGQARIRDLAHLVREFEAGMGDETQWETARLHWQQRASERLDETGQHLAGHAEGVTRPLIAQERQQEGWLRRKTPSGEGLDIATTRLIHRLSDELNDDIGEDLGLALAQQLRSEKLPSAPAANATHQWQPTAAATLADHLQSSVDAAMEKPGTPAQRFFHSFFRTLSWLMPLAAASWAVYFLVRRFYLGTLREQAFLGLDFAIHSLLMILLGWLIPWIIQRQLKPSLARSVRAALVAGIGDSVKAMKAQLMVVFDQVREQREDQLETLEKVKQEIGSALT